MPPTRESVGKKAKRRNVVVQSAEKFSGAYEHSDKVFIFDCDGNVQGAAMSLAEADALLDSLPIINRPSSTFWQGPNRSRMIEGAS